MRTPNDAARMNILHILIDIRSSWGGPVRSVRELARIQREAGHEVSILSLAREGAAEPFGDATVIAFPPSFPARFGNSDEAIDWLSLNARRFDLVLVSEIWSVMIQRAMARLRAMGVPYVVQPRGSLDPYDLRKKGALKRILGPMFVKANLQGAHCVLTASEAEEERMETFGAKVTRKTLPHPIRPNPPGDRERLRNELGIPGETVVFLFLSRLDPKKRVDLLLEAFEQAAKRMPACKLLIAGDGQSQFVEELKKRASSLSCAAAVQFLGFQTGQRKSDLLAAADVFVLPSDFENFGIAVVEALHAGLPVVLSQGVQLWKGIVAARAGLAFDGKAEELASLLVRLGTEPGLRSTMARDALAYAARFTPERLAPEYAEFWASAAKGSGPALRILIYRIASLGDTVIGLPAFRRVRELFPRAHIAVLTSAPLSAKVAPLESIIENMNLVDEVIHYPLYTRSVAQLSALRATIRKGRFDIMISLTGARGLRSSIRDYLFFKSCGIRKVIGIPFEKRDLVCQPIAGTDLYEPECERLMRRISAWGQVDLKESRWRGLDLQPAELAQARRIIADCGVSGPYMAASLGTKVPAKDWGLENWRGLLAEVTAAFPGLGLVLLGAPDEFERSRDLISEWRGPHVNLCGKTSPRVSAGILHDALLFAGHDSGPMHLAAAAGTSCVAIFALRNPPGQWFPLGQGHSIFYPRQPFDPSRTDDLESQQRAIATITVPEVAAAVIGRLSEKVIPAPVPLRDFTNGNAILQESYQSSTEAG